MKTNIFGGLLIAVLAIASAAEAQTRTPVINHRERIENSRINHGIRDGQLTRHEAHHLRSREDRIARQERRDKSRGYVTRAQRTHLRHEENRENRAIYRDTHNRRVRA